MEFSKISSANIYLKKTITPSGGQLEKSCTVVHSMIRRSYVFCADMLYIVQLGKA